MRGNGLVNDRAIFNATTTSSTKIHIDTSCTLSYSYLEIPGIAFNRFEISVSDKFDIQMPADLDQFRRDNSHCTIICRKGLVQLSHSSANGRAFF
jgi:hypothetical protein